MSKVTFSIKVDVGLLSRVRDAVSQHQAAPLCLTMGKLAEAVMRKQVAAARRQGEIPARPAGARAGVPGRRRKKDGDRSRPKRATFSALVPLDVREPWRDLAYLQRGTRELAELFEAGLRSQLSYLERKHGEIVPRETPGNPLRSGRRVR